MTRAIVDELIDGFIDDGRCDFVSQFADQLPALADLRCGRASRRLARSVTTPEGGRAITALVVRTFGTVDILINNAGSLRRAMFADMAMEYAREVIDVHLMGAFHVTQPAWKIMMAKGYGRVLMTSRYRHHGRHGHAA